MTYQFLPLGELASLQAGFGFPVELQGRTSGDYPFAKVGDISRCGRSASSVLAGADHYVDVDDLETLRAKLVPAGSILFAKIGEAIRQNHRVIAGCEMLIDNNAMAAIPNDKVDGRFLFHFLKTVDFYRLAPATTLPALRKSDLEKLPTPCPSLPEQRRIAAILDKADALRAKRREALAQLDCLAQSIFVEMFGDPVTNPNKLIKKPLADLLKVKSGDFLPASEMDSEGQYPVFGGNGINGYHDEYMFERRQIVIGRVGVYCGCIHVTPPNSWITDNALYVSEHDPKVDFDFLAFSLRLANLNQYASQSAQPLISGARIYPVEILVPSERQQKEFIARTTATQKVGEQCTSSLKELDALFSSLQHRAFRGEL